MEEDGFEAPDTANQTSHRALKNYVLHAGIGQFRVDGSPIALSKETQKALKPLLRVASLVLIFWIFSVTHKKDAPKPAELLLSLTTRHSEREAVIGDLFEKYRRKYEAQGKFRADLYAYSEAFRSAFYFGKNSLTYNGLRLLLGKWIRKLTS